MPGPQGLCAMAGELVLMPLCDLEAPLAEGRVSGEHGTAGLLTMGLYLRRGLWLRELWDRGSGSEPHQHPVDSNKGPNQSRAHREEQEEKSLSSGLAWPPAWRLPDTGGAREHLLSCL